MIFSQEEKISQDLECLVAIMLQKLEVPIPLAVSVIEYWRDPVTHSFNKFRGGTLHAVLLDQ
ncbi:hypothetical protein BCY86_04090 [Pajaroellobacter abortibovis]|uniref:Uncharacterized protein n=1 Tax=Pajaroellobacter abortibovis TaxID=1882918 RepID=A0A1L6MWN4_9BACT|nr:hypothetical protein BCY86_04090 [Pajaroellobacter abortibovis]